MSEYERPDRQSGQTGDRRLESMRSASAALSIISPHGGHALKAALALHFAHCNFCRVHGSLRVTPVMEAGIRDHMWTIGEPIGV